MIEPSAVVGKLTWAVCACAVGLTAGCARAEPEIADKPSQVERPAPVGQPAAMSGQSVTIAYASRPDPPTSGDNAIDVTVKTPDGSPVTDAAVAAVFSMPAMPSMNMPAMSSQAALMHAGEGVYRGTSHLSMGGTWNVTITVARGGAELGAMRFSVVTK